MNTQAAAVDVSSDLQVEIEMDSPIRIVRPGALGQIALAMTNPTGSDLQLEISLVLTDYDRRTTVRRTSLAIAPRDTARWWPDDVTLEPGIFYVAVDVADPSGTVAPVHVEESFAVMDPAGPLGWHTEPFLYGVCNGPRPGPKAGQYERTARAVAAAGFNVVRCDFYWDAIQPSGPDEWRFEHYDRMVEAFAAQGVEMQVILSYNTRWAAPEDLRDASDRRAWLFAPPAIEPWRRYVATLVERYRDRVRFWEIWNEADIINFWPGTYEQYRDLLRVSYETIKAIDPSLQVMTSGFATLFPHNGRKDHDFQKRVLAECQEWFDVHAHHEHGVFGNFTWVVDGPLAEARSALKTRKPLYFNETAMNAKKIGERRQAETFVRKLIYARARGAVGFTWYCLKASRERGWGMTGDDYQPRAVYVAHNALVAQLRGASYEHELDLGDDRLGFVFRSPIATTVVVWSDGQSRASVPYVLAVGEGARASAVDIMGRSVALECADGMVVWDVSPRPGFLRVEGAGTAIEAAGPLIDLKTSWAPGEAGAVHLLVTLRNPLASEAAFRITCSGKARDVIVPGHGSSQTEFVASPDDSTGALTLAYVVDGTPWRGTASTYVPPRIVIPSDRTDAAPDIVLDEYDQVVNLCENVPQLEHLMWRGPFDLSANVWFALEEDDLVMRAEVQDNIHEQPFSGADIWRGDSVLLALADGGAESLWTIGFARGDSGTPLVHVWNPPQGAQDPSALITLTTDRVEDPCQDNHERAPHSLTRYAARIPLGALGITAQRLRAGVRMNVVVNDCDDGLRKGWIALAHAPAAEGPHVDVNTMRPVVFA